MPALTKVHQAGSTRRVAGALAERLANATFVRQDFLPAKQEPTLTLTRRRMFAATTIFAGAGFAGAGLLRPLDANAAAETDMAELAKAGPDGDIVVGSAKAPVTVIEYASMTCPHCAHFATTTFPELQKRYIDTGKVRFIFREFPFDALAAAGFMLARCAGNDKFMPVVETLFAKQDEWLVRDVKGAVEKLREISKQFGFTQESFDKCLANQQVLNGIQDVRDRAAEKLGVNSTPTFFVNGKKLVGDQSMDALTKEIEPYLKEG
jgi:protein-disulfide isomerase